MYLVKGLRYARLTKIRNGIRKKRVSQSISSYKKVSMMKYFNEIRKKRV